MFVALQKFDTKGKLVWKAKDFCHHTGGKHGLEAGHRWCLPLEDCQCHPERLAVSPSQILSIQRQLPCGTQHPAQKADLRALTAQHTSGREGRAQN